MLLTAILFTAVVISIFNIILTHISPMQHENLRIGVVGYFLCLSTIFIEHLVEYAGLSCDFPHFIFFSASFYLFLFPFFNIIVDALFSRKIKWNMLLLEILPGVAYTFIMIPFFILPGDMKCRYLTNFVAESRPASYKHLILIGILLIQTLTYSVIWYQRIQAYVREVKLKISSTEIEFIPWFLRIMGVISLFTFIVILGWLGRVFWPGNYYIIDQVSNGVLSLIPCAFLFLLFFLPERPFPNLDQSPDESNNQKEFSQIEHDHLQRLMQEEKHYLNSDLSLSQVADIMHLSRHDLSALLKQGFQQSFYDLVNEYRIEHAKTLMEDHSLIKKFSLSGIARESGFNNYVSFYRVFKRLTRLTPSEYLKDQGIDTE